MKYGALSQTHPAYKADLWKKARAFHKGGEALLEDEELIGKIFPSHLFEDDGIYSERKARAFYIPYMGEIINSILSGLFADELEFGVGDDKGMPDEYYSAFVEDCSPVGGERLSFEDFLKKQVLTALLCKTAWTLVDFPSPRDEDGEVYTPESLAEEEALGVRSAYVCAIDPEMVIDWYEDEKSGALKWAIVRHASCEREDPSQTRDTITETFTLYTDAGWERYQITYKKDEQLGPDKEVPLVDEGKHSFGAVPLVRLDVGDDLWIANKIMSIACAHFNLRNALSWAEYKSLFPVAVAFKEGMNPLNPITEDPDRDVNQVVGQGHIMSLSDKDRFEFVGPDSTPYATAIQDLQFLRDEMHRVVHQMAMSVDNSGAALKRSGDSKQMDYMLTALLFYAYAACVKQHALRVIKLIEFGRMDEPQDWAALGMDSYDEMSLDSLLAQAETIDTISLPSATFQRLHKFLVAQRLIGDSATAEQMEEIRKELEQNISNEQFNMPDMMEMGQQGNPFEKDEEEEEEPFPEKE